MTNLTSVDLFSGAGGLTLAASMLGIKVLAAVENNKHACKTYTRNFLNSGEYSTKLYNKDILRLPPKQLMTDVGLKEGELDILMGGPPCQGFSSHRLNDSGVNDPRNKLLLRYFKFVRAICPKVFVVENVPGILWARHKEYLAKFKSLAIGEGYSVVEPVILNARDYGVPQNRKRVFMLGHKNTLPTPSQWPPAPTHCNYENFQFPPNDKQPWVPASTVFGKPCPDGDPNAVRMKHSQELISAFEKTPVNGGSRIDSGRVLACHKNHNGHNDVYGRIDPTKPGPTMTTACINPSKGRFVHPTENHGITLRHAARFQSFPDTFIFEGGLMAGGAQVGNAVPIKLGVCVLSAIASFLLQTRAKGLLK